MFGKYFVVKISMNLEGGVAQTIEAFETERKAKDKYYDYLSTFGGNPQTKLLKVVLLNANANEMKEETIDNSIYAPIE